MDLGLKGKVIIVTGSAGGLGREYAIAFSKEGANVVVCDLLDCKETVERIEANGGEVLSLRTDVTSEQDTIEMARKAFERFGRIDVLVNNAGLLGGVEYRTLEQLTGDEWDKMMASHAKGTFLCCKAVFPFMKKQGQGKIVNIASGCIFSASTPLPHYAAAKGAVRIFSRTLARELGVHNINVNVVAPGLVMTKANVDMVTEEFVTSFMQGLSLKRLQQPESPVGTVLFLASNMANDITGQTILVDCGHDMP